MTMMASCLEPSRVSRRFAVPLWLCLVLMVRDGGIHICFESALPAPPLVLAGHDFDAVERPVIDG